MSKEEMVVMQGEQKFAKETVDAIGAKTFYCEDCGAWHAGEAGIEWPDDEIQLSIEELEKKLKAGTLKVAKEEAENIIKLYKGLKVRRMV